jgi:hypothetical protein
MTPPPVAPTSPHTRARFAAYLVFFALLRCASSDGAAGQPDSGEDVGLQNDMGLSDTAQGDGSVDSNAPPDCGAAGSTQTDDHCTRTCVCGGCANCGPDNVLLPVCGLDCAEGDGATCTSGTPHCSAAGACSGTWDEHCIMQCACDGECEIICDAGQSCPNAIPDSATLCDHYAVGKQCSLIRGSPLVKGSCTCVLGDDSHNRWMCWL